MGLKASRLRKRMKCVSDEQIAKHVKNEVGTRIPFDKPVVIAAVDVDCGSDPPLRWLPSTSCPGRIPLLWTA